MNETGRREKEGYCEQQQGMGKTPQCLHLTIVCSSIKE